MKSDLFVFIALFVLRNKQLKNQMPNLDSHGRSLKRKNFETAKAIVQISEDAFNLKDQKKWIHHFISSSKYNCL